MHFYKVKKYKDFLLKQEEFKCGQWHMRDQLALKKDVKAYKLSFPSQSVTKWDPCAISFQKRPLFLSQKHPSPSSAFLPLKPTSCPGLPYQHWWDAGGPHSTVTF